MPIDLNKVYLPIPVQYGSRHHTEQLTIQSGLGLNGRHIKFTWQTEAKIVAEMTVPIEAIFSIFDLCAAVLAGQKAKQILP